MRVFACLLAAIVAFVASPALAWGDYGHRTIAAIAMENVTPRTRAEIRKLLHAAPELVTPECPVQSLEDASVWPDCVRRESWRWGYTFPWHYQNISICKPFDIKANCLYGNCVSAQIDRHERLLADRRLSAEQRLRSLMFVTHLVGDLHQPLHVGENGDLGGNRVKADYGIAPDLNLHRIWDGPEAERAISSASPPLVRRYSAGEKARLATGSVTDWARESWQVSRDFLYPAAFGKLPCDGPEAGHVVWTDAAIEKAIPIVDERIERAGIRLAKMLDAALD
ncbi:S1/P1 nuclease [Novosphingobium mangrovi (ex Huang et al. 2023)]|uniref:S1/P1 nuclease n=1 Tax=Novosphingobium mangrovi (ex Huang et al. 2023) TaxID=2976432 RepID=A0ABT2HZY5_9SPHN|nr:S1/P1 nuclease [Novosphingobium mangrovi (ex Huang et al. 2023)]MCT2398104.1 S1/P1 nuclease [Novosphingobium mangrovi (ex Huang et al. 2023)]